MFEKVRSSCCRALVVSLLAFPTLALAIDFPEIEPNDSKAAATANGTIVLNAGDSISGTTTGTALTGGGLNSADYFRLQINSGVGLTRHRLTQTAGSATLTPSIRGLTQTSGVINPTSDAQIQAGTGTPEFLQWYGFGQAEELFVRVTGTTATTARYEYQLSSVGTSFIVGPVLTQTSTITISRAGHTTDTDFWVYDSGFNAVPNFGNDDPNSMTRTFVPGVYYLAYTTFNFANDQPAATGETFLSGAVMDFPRSAANSSASTASTNLSVRFTDAFGSIDVAAGRALPFEIVWIQFFVDDAPGACCLNDGFCVDSPSAASCADMDGTFQGPFSDCLSVFCPIREACCFPNGSCEMRDVTPSDTCTPDGGVRQGFGSSCTPNPCPQPEACCLPGGACSVILSSDCVSQGGVPIGGSSCGVVSYPPPVQWPDGFIDIRSRPDAVDLTSLGDDGNSGALPLGFSHSHYGNSFSSLYVNANGVVSFSPLSGTNFSNTALPNLAAPNNALYPLWDDLNMDPLSSTPGHGTLHFAVTGWSPNRIAIVQWTEVPQFGIAWPTSSNSFQVQIFETSGCVEFHYAQIDVFPPADATVGVENAAGNQATYNDGAGILADNLRLVYCPAGNPCPQPSGACCLDGVCQSLTRAQCQQQCGTYEGDGPCGPLSCAPINDYLTTCGESYVHIGIPGSIYPPLPPNFFGPGSDPFIGIVLTEGVPLDPGGLGSTDTIVRRPFDPVVPPDPIGAAGSVPIEIVALHLQSTQPVTVTHFGGSFSSQWDVEIRLSVVPQAIGNANALKTHANGGTWGAVLPVQPRFTFREVGGPGLVQLDAGLFGFPPIMFNMTGEDFVHVLGPPVALVTDPDTNWKIGVRETIPGDLNSQETTPIEPVAPGTAAHGVCSTRERRCIYRITCIEGSDCANLPVGINMLIAGSPCPNGTCTTAIFHRWGDTNCCIHAVLVDCSNIPVPVMPITLPCPCVPRGACCLPGGCVEGVTAADCAAGGGFYYGDGTSCPSCDDGNPCTDDSCDPATGACVSTPSPAGTPCPLPPIECFASVCDGFGNCVYVVTPGAACADDGNPCTDDICDAAGVCTHPPKPFGAPCPDDGNPCTDDICDGAGGCIHPPHPAGMPCGPGGVCFDEVCDGAGNCVVVFHPFGAPCGPGGLCFDEICDGFGNCIVVPKAFGVICGPGTQCTDEICDGLGNCIVVNVADGTPCNDGNPCTVGDRCIGGVCVGGPPVVCDDGNPCTTDACNPATGLCVFTPVPDGTPCNDGNACTGPDRCIGGACTGPPVNCNDGNACTADSCDPLTGCVNTPIVCNDGDPCTDDSCDPINGCVFVYACQACCFPNGSCADLRPAACASAGGVSQGPGTLCATTICGVPDPCNGVLVGDANCDGSVNNFDIDYFVEGVLVGSPPDPVAPTPGYLALGGTPACWAKRRCWGDVNCDGLFNNFDIDPFVACILAPPPPGNGCPGCGPQACCLGAGSCANLFPAGCTLSGGVPQGPGSNCGIVICP
ncbi:MAG: hypothetical protein HRU75_15000 [Planctomycetia bacterium]|nr:MAG: hypothetical protein HRU75_15000 [Planctomycetia bacterium]